MSAGVYVALSRLGRVVRTGEAAAALKTSLSQASHSLRRLERQGLARSIRRGLWVIGSDPVDPRTLIEDITRPYSAYLSFLSALNAHGVIDQLPRTISVASLRGASRVKTALATYEIHHIPASLFGGWVERNGIKMAGIEKALFDLAYVSAAHRARQRHVPELDLPRRFKRAELNRWLARIDSTRVRTLTERGLRQMLQRAVR